ncbi:peptidase [Mesorhizobium sp. M8A.F.Ca.ET.208.01.1.1]|uniref:prohead protease/major capsid protein fusion protein n=1 Tax=unclassified Mesorhizobium TaxID=325217 RepID=UPI001093FA63|nr:MULTISPECIES: prohead protease/major capsid protein fusion protein [unclassified Mesorhizobium]TGQ92185.1 peptidase [Mesorhizobium sp. M8A.F.Ca.ET.208.01.1.1]TGT52085.1 peptidase [Mesorhizobium sp. M8A.F.Ca.ET.167.01.1.1]
MYRHQPAPQPATLDLPVQHRGAAVRAASYQEADNTIEIVWTTGAKVRRVSWVDGPYDEELEVSASAVRLDRLNAGAPFLNTHASADLADVIGAVVPGSARIERGKGVARVQLSDAPADADIVAKIKNGVIRNISVGYRVHTVMVTERDGEPPLHSVIDWEPLEISAVPIPADPGAQVRSEAETFPATISKGGRKMPAANPNPAPAAVEAERVRNDIIADLATRTGQVALGKEHIASGTTVEEFRRVLVERLAEDQERDFPSNGARHLGVPATVSDDSLDHRRARAMESAIAHRVDPARFKLEAGAEHYMSSSLLDLARRSIEDRGGRTYGMSKMQIASEALAQRSGLHSTSDFPTILSNVAGKSLRAAYDAVPQTFRPLVREVTVPDFKDVTRASISEAPQFEKVNEHGEFKRGSMSEGAEKYRIATFGKIIGITRQALVNDDLDAFGRIPRAFGIQAAQLESDVVWAQLLANPTMGDNAALFHANHGNLLTSGAIGATTVGEARLKMGLQTGLDGKTVLNLTPSYLIVPKALEIQALTFLATISPTQQNDAVASVLKNLTLIAEPRLDLGVARYNIAGDQHSYYFAAAPAYVDLIELAYLEGAQGVYTETKQGFDVDGVEIKVRLDVGAKVIDWRGLSKNPYSG